MDISQKKAEDWTTDTYKGLSITIIGERPIKTIMRHHLTPVIIKKLDVGEDVEKSESCVPGGGGYTLVQPL